MRKFRDFHSLCLNGVPFVRYVHITSSGKVNCSFALNEMDNHRFVLSVSKLSVISGTQLT